MITQSERDYKDGQLKAPHDSEADSSATNNIKITGKIDWASGLDGTNISMLIS